MFQSRRARPAARIRASRTRCTGGTVSLTRESTCTVLGKPRAGPRRSLQMTTATERDARHLERAIELAVTARGTTSPNPMVGAVVVKDGRVIGEGITQPPGESHAERMALAGCRDAILEAGIARVVIASDDPTSKAAGRGPGILRDEGVDVEFADGDIAAAARLVNQPFRKHARTGRPLVV